MSTIGQLDLDIRMLNLTQDLAPQAGCYLARPETWYTKKEFVGLALEQHYILSQRTIVTKPALSRLHL